MAIVSARITVDTRLYWSQFFGGLLGNPSVTTIPGISWNPVLRHFKVGEGGWLDLGSGRVRRNPVEDDLRREDNNIQDIDAIVDPTRPLLSQRYPAVDRAFFQKTLDPSDFTFESPSTLRVRCFLDSAEFNDDGNGNSPEIWEIAVFADHPIVSGEKLMVAYATVPQQIKTNARPLENIVRIALL